MENTIKKEIGEHIEIISQIPSNYSEKIKKAVEVILGCYEKNGKVVLFGNGGSAADAQHIAAEFIGRFKKERKSLAAIALTTNTSVLSALANDYDFNMIFERQVEGLVNSNDTVIGISTSGTSENVIKGMLKAKKIGAKTIAFTGKGGGKLRELADVLIDVPSDNTPRIQEVHIAVGHIICGLVEKNYFEEN